ncbi:MAG: metabolite traffic protein EboE [Planctomycetales bacterium]
MAFSRLPLSYCTNVHPGRTLAEVEQGLDQYTVPVQANWGAPLAAGLWLAAPVVRELLDRPGALSAFRESLRRRGLTCHTLNAFPYGDFHSRRVKDNVYLPDWSDPRRLDYTADCARILAELLPEGADGSISTAPLSFKGFAHPPEHWERYMHNLVRLAADLERLHEESGRTIRLAIEPEPCCLLETTDEAIRFFQDLWRYAAEQNRLEVVLRHLGLCYDVCHQAVEFEDVEGSIAALVRAGVRINKVHITCALQLDDPAENSAGRQALARYAEERYLHQTLAPARAGGVLRHVDLTEALALDPPPEFRHAPMWRVHFHVPVDAEQLGPLRTTRDELRKALRGVQRLNDPPHLEVETYTWEVLPDAVNDGSPTRLIDGLTRELVATRELLGELATEA